MSGCPISTPGGLSLAIGSLALLRSGHLLQVALQPHLGGGIHITFFRPLWIPRLFARIPFRQAFWNSVDELSRGSKEEKNMDLLMVSCRSNGGYLIFVLSSFACSSLPSIGIGEGIENIGFVRSRGRCQWVAHVGGQIGCTSFVVTCWIRFRKAKFHPYLHCLFSFCATIG